MITDLKRYAIKPDTSITRKNTQKDNYTQITILLKVHNIVIDAIKYISFL